ncbi:MAG: succinate dehydrogenase/fumarate reductase iron-sulfur subunit [Methanosarcina sp.]
MKLKVFRFDRENEESHYDTFEIESLPGMTVLSALFKIQEKLDDSLAFRYSCRGAVCGSCAMLINRIPALACRTRIEPLLKGEGKIKLKPFSGIEDTVSWNPENEVLVEPLPSLPKVKDLIVDMDKFFELYRTVEPTFKPAFESPKKEQLMQPDAVKELEKYTNCILCAACVGSCPVSGKNINYMGPAALAKLYRFHIDPREADAESRLMLANSKLGWWGCEFHANCKAVCPKGVPPIEGIAKARKEIKELGKKPD